MKNQITMQTEPGDDGIAREACEIWAKRPGPVRLAAPIQSDPKPAWLDGQETSSKLIEGLSRMQIKSNTVMNGTSPLAEWCHQLPALRLESEGAPGFRWHKNGWQAKNKQEKK
jgi:hypothetical protein